MSMKVIGDNVREGIPVRGIRRSRELTDQLLVGLEVRIAWAATSDNGYKPGEKYL